MALTEEDERIAYAATKITTESTVKLWTRGALASRTSCRC